MMELAADRKDRRLAGMVFAGDNEEYIEIPDEVMQYGSIMMRTDITDAHAYLIKGNVFNDYILSKTWVLTVCRSSIKYGCFHNDQ